MKKMITALFMGLLSHSINATHESLEPYTIDEEISFWAFQEKEHAEFCIDFTHQKALQEEGKKLASRFQALTQQVKNKEKEFLNLTCQAITFQNKVRSALEITDPDYQVKKDLIDHMNLEARYASKKIDKKNISEKDEIKFWLQEHEQEASTVAYFINDDETPLKQEALALAHDLHKEDNQGKPQARIVRIANQELNELDATLEQNPGISRMPFKLAQHEKRERMHAQKILQSIKKQKPHNGKKQRIIDLSCDK